MKPMNGSKPDARELIDRIMSSERLQASSHFSERVYASEPILTTGRQMASYLPERYREMKAISRLDSSAPDGRRRWLSEAELFYRQARFMEDFEDDCPYPGTFTSYFPTYNAMSDRQLRGYFTWRAAVRRGDIEEASPSFAYLYLYELICGIGVNDPRDGFGKIESFWQAYRAFSPEIDRYARVWLQDYVVYHALPPSLLEPWKTLRFDRALTTFAYLEARLREGLASPERQRRKKGVSALPLPCDAASENELFTAIDTLSTYRLTGSRLYKAEPEALRHVCCAVLVRMTEYYLKQRMYSLMESWFGGMSTMAYTMFGSAVFFDPVTHPDAEYELDKVHRYRCDREMWSCTRFQGGLARNAKLGQAMRSVDRMLREALGFEHPLKEQKGVPKYLQGFISDEIEAWMSWRSAHAPRHIDIDLSRLSGIRDAAAITREALLIDEEREGTGTLLDAADGTAVRAVGAPAGEVTPTVEAEVSAVEADAPATEVDTPAVEVDTPVVQAEAPVASARVSVRQVPEAATDAFPTPGLSHAATAYLRALIEGDRGAADAALDQASTSEDILVDAINETLFDLIGDTVIEYGPDGPKLIEDYREDVEGFLNHE